jgi:tetratricopeptide (TPR) repeat protein
MSRISDGAKRASLIALASAAAWCATGCEQLEGRNGIREGNRAFRDMQFVDAAAAYEKALRVVQSPIVHYNLGLAYSRLYKPGYEKPILLGEMTDPICAVMPGVKPVEDEVCVKRPEAKDQSDRRRFNPCSKDDVCPSSFECKKTTLCSALSAELADRAAQHLQVWVKAQLSDDEIDQQIAGLNKDIEASEREHKERWAAVEAARDAAKARLRTANPTLNEGELELKLSEQPEHKAREVELQRVKGIQEPLRRRIDELNLKSDMRNLATQVWIDTSQYDKAIAFWESELAASPAHPRRTPRIMSIIAGTHLKANDWRKAIEWYRKAAAAEAEPSGKVANLRSIGNLAWSKLNSKQLFIDDSVELADYAIGALQEAATMEPKLATLYSLQATILGFKAATQGASFAAAIERAHSQDLLRLGRVLREQANKQQSKPAPGAPPAPPAAPVAPAPAQGPAPAAPAGTMSGGPATSTGG